MPTAPWLAPRGVESVVTRWQASGAVQRCLAAERSIGAQAAAFSAFPQALDPALTKALAASGIHQLYTHQEQAITAALAGRHTVIATPTASGKSLCFHLPVAQAIASTPSASALYLYPTKALSRDQEHSVQQLLRNAGLSIPAMVFDGDTPGDVRRSVRERGRIILTNPDMLHSGILPNHARWAAMFQDLRYVVLDELHTYRGVFGSHMAHVIARLKRIASFHGSNPTFLCATATIGNPRQHAARLLGVAPEEVELVERSGAPTSSRQVYLYNPPVVNQELGVRGSALKHSVSLAADLVEARVPTIVFGPSRNSVEVMLKYLRERVGKVAGPGAIMAYRGGYLPDKRRAIEQGLRSGEILCVVATNALELGIDIGDLEAVVCMGYPGSIAATWQRFGRAGRRGKLSIAVMVCGSSPLDQFLAQDPTYLFNKSAEEARIDPENTEVLVQHLKCAAFEAPFQIAGPGVRPASPALAAGEAYASLDVENTRAALEYLADGGVVHHADGRWYWTGDAYPATHVSLRSVGWDNFVIINVETDKSIAELDWRAAHTMLHEQAIYQHDAEQYQVERLDYDNHKAYVRRVEPDYFTTALTYRTVEVLDVQESETWDSGALCGLGEVKVLEKVTGYKKIKFFTHENSGYGDVHLPEMQMHTSSFWLTVSEAMVARLNRPRAEIIDALRGAGQALETVATLALMCEPQDINRTLGNGAGPSVALPDTPGSLPTANPVVEKSNPAGRNPHVGATGNYAPTLFLFDALPGGVGLAPRIFERSQELVQAALSLIAGCRCKEGCPVCIGPAEGISGRRLLAAQLLSELLSSSQTVSARVAANSAAL